MKRKSRAIGSSPIGCLVLIVVAVVAYGALKEMVGSLSTTHVIAAASIAVACVGALVWRGRVLTRRRLEYLRAKYRDEDVVQQILRKAYWQGQTAEQLHDSLGSPADVDKKILKTKSKETWKYDRRGVNRFGLRIIVENGVVVGWDKKA
jgi:hypothetical protein